MIRKNEKDKEKKKRGEDVQLRIERRIVAVRDDRKQRKNKEE